MTGEEAAQLCALVQETCPSQQMGEYTPGLWREAIPDHYTLGECRAAVITMIRRGERYVDVGPMITEVRRVRAEIAERERAEILIRPHEHRAELEAADGAALARIAGRLGRAPVVLKAVPPYEDGGR